MMKRRLKRASWSRGLQALLAASCPVFASCAAEAAMEEGDESLADESGEMAPDEESTTDEPVEESLESEDIATEGDEAPQEEIGKSGDPAEAACVGYGQRCSGSASCRGDMVCAFDGYVRYCRH